MMSSQGAAANTKGPGLRLRFIGVGPQSAGLDQYQSNMVLTAPSGKRMLVDCGGDARFALAESGLRPLDLDAVYISHLHSDHVGGMEWLALSTYFARERRRLPLFGEKRLLRKLWDHSMRGGLEQLRWKRMQLTDFFECHAVGAGTPFTWEGLRFDMVKMRHIVGEEGNHDSYGLLIQPDQGGGTTLFISTDAIFQPDLVKKMAGKAAVIFHDCETTVHHTQVHAHYEQLRTLPLEIRRKIWLYHYQPKHEFRASEDGFLGFVVKGQEFSFPV